MTFEWLSKGVDARSVAPRAASVAWKWTGSTGGETLDAVALHLDRGGTRPLMSDMAALPVGTISVAAVHCSSTGLQ